MLSRFSMMPERGFQVSLITVSDSAYSGESHDHSGPLLAKELGTRSGGALKIANQQIVPDVPEMIERAARRSCDEAGVNLVITTGGTGLSARDQTPEAILPLIHVDTPALSQAITSYSLSKTPLAALSRGISGIRRVGDRRCLLITLPGSPKAVKECVSVLLDGSSQVLLHALKLLNEHDVTETHKSMQQGVAPSRFDPNAPLGSHSCSCCKPELLNKGPDLSLSNDLSTGPARRKRNSPYPMISLDEALQLIDHHVHPLRVVQTCPVDPSLVGYVLAEDVAATEDLPARPTSNVDGYAVNSHAMAAGVYTVRVGSRGSSLDKDSASLHRINTGQALPHGYDAVIMVEDTEVASEVALEVSDQRFEETHVRILRAANPGDHVRAAGSDLKKAQVALREGTHVTVLGGEIGTLAFLGRSSVNAWRKPKIAILSTGNELRDIGDIQPTSNLPQVYDANRPGLIAAIEGQGFECIDLGIVPDVREDTLAKFIQATEQADVVLTTGGTSMGEHDFIKPVLERDLGATIHFGRVAMKPGKPTTFATCGNEKRTPIFALPGNPASAMVCFYLFVLPALRKMASYPPAASPALFGSSTQSAPSPNAWSMSRVMVVLRHQVALDPRPEFHRVIVSAAADGTLTASSTGVQRSSGMHSMATANALLCLPPLKPGDEQALPAGARVSAILLGSIQ